jgi:hypothetical protein
MSQHSKIVGGSTAKRVINCPGSVALVSKMPSKPSSSYADEGTLLHDTIAAMLTLDYPADVFLGKTYGAAVLTQDLIEDKIEPAMALLAEVDPDKTLEFEVEAYVGFGEFMPGVFGSADIIGRRGKTAIVLDWKFGNGVIVDAEENEQLMFYAAAAMRTPATKWAFEGVTDVELIIIQPPMMRRWVTSVKRLKRFEAELLGAVNLSTKAAAPLKSGVWCRWCPASATCPAQSGEAQRTIKTQLKGIDAKLLGEMLLKAEMLEDWIKAARELAEQMLTNNVPVPGYKMVPKRATRQWANEGIAKATLMGMGIPSKDLIDTKMKSPAQVDKLLPKGEKVPADLVTQISSGNTLAPDSDPRPAVMTVGSSLKAALGKL